MNLHLIDLKRRRFCIPILGVILENYEGRKVTEPTKFTFSRLMYLLPMQASFMPGKYLAKT